MLFIFMLLLLVEGFYSIAAVKALQEGRVLSKMQKHFAGNYTRTYPKMGIWFYVVFWAFNGFAFVWTAFSGAYIVSAVVIFSVWARLRLFSALRLDCERQGAARLSEAEAK